MGLDFYFLEDIERALTAAGEASASSMDAARQAGVQKADLLSAYEAGYQRALYVVALAFGVSFAPTLQIPYVRDTGDRIEASQVLFLLPASDRAGGVR